jgi:uncharacterized cupredoxin-like copper-binding protein
VHRRRLSCAARSRRSLALALGFVALAVPGALAGCGSAAVGGAPAGELISVQERDFHIAASTNTVQAGAVTLRIHNAGPDQHELIVLPLGAGESPGGLPLRSDGFTVDEERLQNQEPGAVNPQQAGATVDLAVHLTPGRYILFCNMEGHYMAGMHTELIVAP